MLTGGHPYSGAPCPTAPPPTPSRLLTPSCCRFGLMELSCLSRWLWGGGQAGPVVDGLLTFPDRALQPHLPDPTTAWWGAQPVGSGPHPWLRLQMLGSGHAWAPLPHSPSTAISPTGLWSGAWACVWLRDGGTPSCPVSLW